MCEPCGPYCPVCDRLAVFIVGDEQAFCGNDDCRVLMWDPTMSVADNMADATEVNLSEGSDS